MKNLKVSMKLIVSFGIVLVTMIVMAVVALIGMTTIADKMTALYKEDFNDVLTVGNIMDEVEQLGRNSLYGMLTQDMAEKQSRVDKVKEQAELIQKYIEEFEKEFKGDKNLLKSLEDNIKNLSTNIPIVEQAILLTDTESAFKQYEIYINPYMAPALELVEEIEEWVTEEAHNTYQQSEDTANVLKIVAIIVTIISLIIGISLSLILTAAFLKPIKDIEESIIDISNGKLDTEILYESRDEFGQMADAMRLTVERLSKFIRDASHVFTEMSEGNFNVNSECPEVYVGEFQPLYVVIGNMSRDLSHVIQNIREAANQVDSGSAQVSGGAQALAQGATEQASSIQELSATIAEVSDKINKNAADAKNASLNVTKIGEEADMSNRRMQEMLEAMRDISDKSAQINNIIKTIEDIAFQTNILALNASVEAARAGEAGKGFAVVADEVKNLAGKSAEASSNTAKLIQETIHAVDNGSKIANETAESMGVVIDEITGIVKMIDAIASASEMQSDAMIQVNTGVGQISGVVQSNSATAEQSAAASEELAGQAATLQGLVAHFILR